jgi:hypothetical protein
MTSAYDLQRALSGGMVNGVFYFDRCGEAATD